MSGDIPQVKKTQDQNYLPKMEGLGSKTLVTSQERDPTHVLTQRPCAEVDPSMCFVSQFSMHKMGMVAVPLSQALTPMRCCDMKLQGCERYLNIERYFNGSASENPTVKFHPHWPMGGGETLSAVNNRKQKVLVALVTSTSISWVRCQDPRYYVSLWSVQKKDWEEVGAQGRP